MRLLTRYVLIEVFKVFGIALASLTILMMIVGVAREAMSQGLGLAQIAQLMPYILPDALRFAVPATILFAVSIVYGRMSGTNEVVAIKSQGISPMTIIWPALILAFLLSLATTWLNDVAVSWGRNGVRRVALEAVEEIAYGMLRTQRAYTSPQMSINVKRVEGRKLIHPTLTLQAGDSQQPQTLVAEEAELVSDPQNDTLRIVCRNFTVDGENDLHIRDPGVFEIAIPLQDASRVDRLDSHPSRLPMWRFEQEIASQRVKIAEYEQEMAVLASHQLLTGDFPRLMTSEMHIRGELLKAYREHLYRLKTEPYRRWANGFSCLCFVLIGAPMAIRMRNADLLTSFFLCFLPILLVYYPLLAWGVDASKHGRMPSYTVWLGNVILAVWGVWLLRKVLRY